MLAAKNKERKVCFLIFFYGYEMRKVKRKKINKEIKKELMLVAKNRERRETKRKKSEEKKKRKEESETKSCG